MTVLVPVMNAASVLGMSGSLIGGVKVALTNRSTHAGRSQFTFVNAGSDDRHPRVVDVCANVAVVRTARMRTDCQPSGG